MDSSLNHFKASQGRRNLRREKKNRKYTSSAANKLKVEYKSQLKQSNFTKENKLALRKRLLEQQRKKRISNLITLAILALVIGLVFIWLLSSDWAEFKIFG